MGAQPDAVGNLQRQELRLATVRMVASHGAGSTSFYFPFEYQMRTYVQPIRRKDFLLKRLFMLMCGACTARQVRALAVSQTHAGVALL